MAKFPIGKTRVGHTLYADITNQVKVLGKRLNSIEKEVSVAVANSLAEVAHDILEESNRACPIDSGALRNSAKAFLARQGRRDLHIIYQVRGAGNKDPESGEVVGRGPQMPQLSQEWNLLISYSRYNAKGEDIAVWTHEDLHSYGSESPAAKQPGTGPKYLEKAYINNYKSIESSIGAMMQDRLRKLTSRFMVRGRAR